MNIMRKETPKQDNTSPKDEPKHNEEPNPNGEGNEGDEGDDKDITIIGLRSSVVIGKRHYYNKVKI